MLLLLEFDLCGRTDLEHCNPSGELCTAFLEFLTVVVRIGVFDLSLNLIDSTCYIRSITSTFNDSGLVLGDHDFACLAEHVEGYAFQLEADFLRDNLTTGEDGDVLEHGLAAFTETRGFDRYRSEGTADLVDHERGESFTFNIFGNDQQRSARLHHLFKHRHEITHSGDLRADKEDVRVVEHGFHAFGVGDAVRRDITLVEAHTFNEVEIKAEGLAFFNGDDTVFADVVDGIGDR